MTQMEALRQKMRYNRKASTVTLNKGDVVLMRNDQFVRKRKIKDHWGDEVYTVQPSRHGCACVCHQNSARLKANPSQKLTLPNQES